MTDPTTVAVVLAGGEGRRFTGAGNKLAAELGGRPLLAHAVAAAFAAGIGPVVLVTGAAAEPPVDPRSRARLIVVVNDQWARGQATSLRAGLDEAARRGAEAAVIGLGDQPFITPGAWRAVAASDAPIAVATYAGRRGHPVRLHRDLWPLLPTSGDEGARAIMRLRPQLVEEVPCEGSPLDIDTVEDLRRWQNNSSTSSP
jgi:CTP:molybdopterin cytidylyltransferase MocA